MSFLVFGFAGVFVGVIAIACLISSLGYFGEGETGCGIVCLLLCVVFAYIAVCLFRASSEASNKRELAIANGTHCTNCEKDVDRAYPVWGSNNTTRCLDCAPEDCGTEPVLIEGALYWCDCSELLHWCTDCEQYVNAPYCPDCGQSVQPSGFWCVTCGQGVTTRYCRNCGTANPNYQEVE